MQRCAASQEIAFDSLSTGMAKIIPPRIDGEAQLGDENRRLVPQKTWLTRICR
jgi:hypothetical protein